VSSVVKSAGSGTGTELSDGFVAVGPFAGRIFNGDRTSPLRERGFTRRRGGEGREGKVSREGAKNAKGLEKGALCELCVLCGEIGRLGHGD